MLREDARAVLVVERPERVLADLDLVERRLALRVIIPQEAALDTERTINDLLGKDVSARFKFIMERAAEVKELDV